MAIKSKVYFAAVKETDPVEVVKKKLAKLLEASKVLDCVRAGDEVAVKMHFGEKGNTGYVKPEYVKVICDDISGRKAAPLLTDTNTLYHGMRAITEEHLAIARDHGFSKERAGAEVVIPDDNASSNVAEIRVGGKFIEVAKVVSFFLKADAFVGIAHFKGHLMAGFGGALKNIGMGCATREGKLAQHSEVAPYIDIKKCELCGACVEACPAQAIYLKGHQVVIDGSKCIGCASCIAACTRNAVEIDWESGGSDFQEKMVEYAKAVLGTRQGRSAFINFALKITKECDCLALDDPRIVPDIGIFASEDPVSIDKACYDMVLDVSGRDIFKVVHPRRDGSKQLRYAADLGIGTMDYELVTV